MEKKTCLHSYSQALCLMNWWLFWRLRFIIFRYDALPPEKCCVNRVSSFGVQLWQEYVLKTHFYDSNVSFISENKVI